MEIYDQAIRENFQSKTDTELLGLVDSGPEMTSDARFLLAQELECRLEKAKQAAEAVPLIHGWYTVVAPTAGIRFPDLCPRCSRFADSNSLRFASSESRRFHLLWWKTTRAVSNVPHCSGCVSELKRSRNVCLWTGALAGFLWIFVVVRLRLPKFVSYVGGFVISAPFVYFYDRTSAVKLGDFSEEFVEYRFRSHEYAKAFAWLNNVQSENAGTLQGELEEAVARIRS
jgi:hypothetical protein